MRQRKPGDYVVNAELTDEQRERFVQDCVAAGCEDIGDCHRWEVSTWNLNCEHSDHVEGVDESYALRNDVRDVTNEYRKEYKDNPMTQADLMRQIADAMERNPDGWWREFERQVYIGYRHQRWIQCCSPVILLDELKGDNIRPKPRTYILHIKDMPEPMREEPEYGSDYYFVMPVLSSKTFWSGGEGDRHLLEHGACYPDKESAQQAMDKLKAAMGGNND